MARTVWVWGLLSFLAAGVSADDLTVLTPELAGGPPQQMLTRLLKRRGHEALARRRAAYEQINTPDDAVAWQTRLLGQSLVGLRAEDVLICARFLAEWEQPAQPVRVHLLATGVVGGAG